MSVTVLGPIASGGVSLPLYSSQVSAGFPSPAADHLEKLISLDELFEIRAPHMYLGKIQGDSMQGAGTFLEHRETIGDRLSRRPIADSLRIDADPRCIRHWAHACA